MATTSFTDIRRFAGFAIMLLFCLGFSQKAVGQNVPLVTVSSAAGLSHPTGWGTILESAIDANGDWLVVDYSNGALYEFPAGGGAAVTLAPPSPSASLGGGYQNPTILIDPGNNLYLGANWNNGLVMFPWDQTNQTWTGLGTLTPSNPTTTICTNSGKNNEANCWAQYGIGGYSQGYFQPWALAVGTDGTILIGNQSSGNYIMSMGVNNAWSNPTVSSVTVEQISAMSARPVSVAQDPEGNVYFVEDPPRP